MRVVTTYRTISIEVAGLAIRAYNAGRNRRGIPNTEIDRQAREMFADGLGATGERIEQQVEFIGESYGGAGLADARTLAPNITRDIIANREQYDQVALSARPILSEVPTQATIEVLYSPFVQRLRNKTNWRVWGTKFWNFLNPEAFPIEDSRVDTFFVLAYSNNPVNKYLTCCGMFRDFVMYRQDWLPYLREVDGGLAWSDNKLWDKMCYGLRERAMME